MGNGDMSNINDFAEEIDSVVDNLFGPYERKMQQAGAGDAGGSIGQAEQPLRGSESAPLAFNEVSLKKERASASEAPGHTIFNQLEEALLTLEWEITPANIAQVQQLLKKVREEFQPRHEFESLLSGMEQVLGFIAQAPENVPVCGPNALKNAAQALRQAFDPAGRNPEKDPAGITAYLKELQVALPPEPGMASVAAPVPVAEKIFKKEGVAPPVPGLSSPPLVVKGVLISAGLYSALEYHISILQQCVNRIVPVEKLFGKTSGYEQLYAIVHNVREKLDKQREFYASALLNDYRCARENTDLPIPEVLFYALQSHVSIFEQCVNRILPLEKLFRKKNGMERLYAILRQLRGQLEKQKAFLARISNGQYRSALERLPATDKTALTMAPCPWKALLTAQWGGMVVAFVPEHVAYEGDAAWWARRKLTPRLASLPMRYLKTWPWTKIQPRLQGALAAQSENLLESLDIPVLNHPGPFQAPGRGKKEGGILILQHHAKSAVVLLESHPERITVSEQWPWEPSSQLGSIVAGHITVDDRVIPVATLEKIQ